MADAIDVDNRPHCREPKCDGRINGPRDARANERLAYSSGPIPSLVWECSRERCEWKRIMPASTGAQTLHENGYTVARTPCRRAGDVAPV